MSFSFSAWMAGLRSQVIPRPDIEREAGLLDEIADRWNCWSLPAETQRQHLFRVQLQLHTLAISIEQDLVTLDEFDCCVDCATDEARDQ